MKVKALKQINNRIITCYSLSNYILSYILRLRQQCWRNLNRGVVWLSRTLLPRMEMTIVINPRIFKNPGTISYCIIYFKNTSFVIVSQIKQTGRILYCKWIHIFSNLALNLPSYIYIIFVMSHSNINIKQILFH